MGECGAVPRYSPKLKKVVEPFLDWDQECWWEPGTDNTCGQPFAWQVGSLARDYDHQYGYSRIGCNLRLKAAVGIPKLKKPGSYVRRRRQPFAYLRTAVEPLSDRLILPEATPGSDRTWFGFPITIHGRALISRDAVTGRLNVRGIATRLLLVGRLTRQAAYCGVPFRGVGHLRNADRITRDALKDRVIPGLVRERLNYVIEEVTRSTSRSWAFVGAGS